MEEDNADATLPVQRPASVSIIKCILTVMLVVLVLCVCLALLLLAWRDRGNVLHEERYPKLPQESLIQTGDIVLSRCHSDSLKTRLRMAVTGSTWTHVLVCWREPNSSEVYLLDSIARPALRLVRLSTMMETFTGHLHLQRRRTPLTEQQLHVVNVEIMDHIWRGAQFCGKDLVLLPDEKHQDYAPVAHVTASGPFLTYEKLPKSRHDQIASCLVKRPLQSVVPWRTNDSILCTGLMMAFLHRIGDVSEDRCVHCGDPDFFVYSAVIREHFEDQIYCLRNAVRGETNEMNDNRLLHRLTEVHWPGPYTDPE
jgi:hypothetical protein